MKKIKPAAFVVNLPEMAERLKAYRGSKNMTQAEVSSAAGKNTATYTYWESGTTEPGSLALARACQHMGCTPNDILLADSALTITQGLALKDAALMASVVTKLAALHRSGKSVLMLQLVDQMLQQAIELHNVKV